MSRNSLSKRLEALEEQTFGADPFRDFPDWDLVDQFEAVTDTLRFFRRHHPDGDVRYPATDREIHLLALLCALSELGGVGRVGEHRFPSGLLVTWRDGSAGDGTHRASASRWALLEDLPEGVRKHFERMDPGRQAERERFLYGDRYRAAEHRRRMRHWELHGEEEQCMRREESKRRDRELLERNRAACGLPPLTPEQIQEWGLAATEDRGEAGR